MGEKKFWGRRNVENVSIIRGVGWGGGGQEYCLKMKREKSVVSFPLSRKCSRETRNLGGRRHVEHFSMVVYNSERGISCVPGYKTIVHVQCVVGLGIYNIGHVMGCY